MDFLALYTTFVINAPCWFTFTQVYTLVYTPSRLHRHWRVCNTLCHETGSVVQSTVFKLFPSEAKWRTVWATLRGNREMKNPIRLILHQQQQLSVKCGPRVRGPHAPPGCNKMAAAHLTDNRSAQQQQIWRWTLYGGSRWSIIHTACLQQEIPAVNNWLLRRVTEMPRMKWSLLNTWDWNAKYSFFGFLKIYSSVLVVYKRETERETHCPSEPRVINSQATRWYLSKVSRFCELRC